MTEISPEQAELAEAEYYWTTEVATPAADRDFLGMVHKKEGGGIVLAVPNDASRFWSMALGFGFAAPVTGDLLDRIIEVWVSAGDATGQLRLAPSVLPAGWDGLCKSRGLTAVGGWVKMAGRADAVTPVETAYRIGPLRKEDGEEFARLTLPSFGMALEGLQGMLAASLTEPDLYGYGAWDDDRLVAAGMLTKFGDVGSLNAGSTHPHYRGRGLQTALLAARAIRAAELGCRWVTSESGDPGPGKVNPSLENMRRIGMAELYTRPNFEWRREA